MYLPVGSVTFLFLQLGLLVLVFGIGFLSGKEERAVHAGNPGGNPAGSEGGNVQLTGPQGGGTTGTQTPGPGESGSSSSSQKPQPTQRPEDEAFQNPANRYTVVVFTADASPVGQGRAQDVFDALESRGYPVITPVIGDRHVRVLMGAAPTKAALSELESRIRREKLGRNVSTGDFYDAYVDRAEKFR